MIPFSNPRKHAEFEDWPIGRDARGKCRFFVEPHPTRGERVGREMTDRYGAWCKAKYTTYANKYAIVDGDDGRTYLLCLNEKYGASVTVKASDMQHVAPGPLGSSYVPAGDPAFEPLKALILAAA